MISNVLARILGDGQSEPDRLSAREVMMQDEATARNGPLSTRKIKMVSERSKESQGGPTTPSEANKSVAPSPPAQTISFRYVDRPELTETFADTITGLSFDGQSLRIEFGVSRLDEAKPDTPLTGRRYPACRLVLPPTTAIELINKMQQIGAAMAKAGVLKPAG
jgi:hypothetical protein